MTQLAFALRVNDVADALAMDSYDDLATISPLRRARTSGRFQRTAVAHWREREGIPVRSGRPSAVTAELASVALQLLREGATVADMCQRVGIDKRSWYRWVHHQAQGQVQVRRYVRTPRHPRSIRAELVRQMVTLDKIGRAHV